MTRDSTSIVRAIVDFERHFGDSSSKQFCIRWKPSKKEVINFMKYVEETVLPEGMDFGPELSTDFVFGLAFRVEKGHKDHLKKNGKPNTD